MGSSPAPFADIGKKATDLLYKDYIFDRKFTLTMLSPRGTEFVATSSKKDNSYLGKIISLFKDQNTIVDLKIDSHSTVSTKVTIKDLIPSAKAVISFNLPDHKSSKFQLDMQSVLPNATLNYTIGLNPTPQLDLSATIGSPTLCIGSEVSFNIASSSLTKYNIGISLNKPDIYVAFKLEDKGESLRASYVHMVNRTTSVGAELTRRFSDYTNSLTIGSSHNVDPFTLVKTRFSNSGKVAMVVHREWSPKSSITFSAEYDSKAVTSFPRLGLALALPLKPFSQNRSDSKS